MEYLHWKDIEGKWNNEPDVLEMDGKGCHMIVLRSPLLGNLNGYVGVNINHPLFLKDMNHKSMNDIWVHGGITFTGKGGEIPHAPFKKNYWYIGFDTAHAMDLVPSMVAMRQSVPELNELKIDLPDFFNQEKYRDLNYVSDQVNQLAVQVDKVKESIGSKPINHKKMYKSLRKHMGK